MSKFSKKTLAAALVAALAVPTAYALVINTDGNPAPEVIATEVGPVVTMTEVVEFTTELADTIIGRTTGVQLLVRLTGAEFGATAPVLSQGPATSGGAWTGVLAAGGTPGSNVAQFTFSPTVSGSTIDEGVFAYIADLSLQNTTGNVSMEVQVVDPVGGTTLDEATRVILVRESGLDVVCTAEEEPLKIDVGGDDPRFFLVDAPYEIGGGDSQTTPLGSVVLDATSGFTFGLDTVFGSSITTDGSLANISRIFLAEDASCTAELIEYDIDYDTNTASFEADEAFDDGTEQINATLCVSVTGEGAVEAQQFTVTGSVNGTSIGACPVAPLAYNGSLVKVYHVNPAGNSQAQSFVRVINQSQTGGNVTVTGWDDAGNEAGPISFYLGARESKQFNSVDLEEGNADKGIEGGFGDGVGKWRLEVLGEFDNMMVQGLNRNRDTGTVTNLTDADGQFEQDLLHRTTLGN